MFLNLDILQVGKASYRESMLEALRKANPLLLGKKNNEGGRESLVNAHWFSPPQPTYMLWCT